MTPTHHPSYLSLDAPIAIYVRSKSEREQQGRDLLAFARKQGWRDEQICIYIQEENEGWHRLIEALRESSFKTILLTDEGSQWTTRFELELLVRQCKEKSVLILTPKMIYDCASEVDVLLLLRKYALDEAHHTNKQEAG
ncbi:hypothetical protein [Ktedonospora formicarum]|uniref:Resolvase/invertase-type recombinase catalytic domain-containing protein n=1 Tax=Ktedonospora formicarum TaxID=2778364 RepID=A0A8J3MUP7_9CHLR|nr:hypothetical protein [Ktedonospora formicarum]GHO45620.1 hypothetical protein KSX_37830 [Ktedonospora formicarum]